MFVRRDVVKSAAAAARFLAAPAPVAALAPIAPEPDIAMGRALKGLGVFIVHEGHRELNISKRC